MQSSETKDSQEDVLNLIDYLIFILKWKKMIVACQEELFWIRYMFNHVPGS